MANMQKAKPKSTIEKDVVEKQPVTKEKDVVESQQKTEDIKSMMSEKDEEINKLKNENKAFENEMNEMKSQLNLLMKQIELSTMMKSQETSSRWNKTCTLVHLLETIPNLPTTIIVNGVPHNFSYFGERRQFRFEDMQQIVSKYRDYFERSVFTLGEDCSEFADDFALKVMDMPMTLEQYRILESLPNEEFKSIIEGININQRILIAKTWIQRYYDNKPNYDNMDKIKILNKFTNGFMKSFLQELAMAD